MNILIKGMEMPESCIKCLCFERCYTRGIFDPLGWCHITGTELLSPNPPQDCPLVPVPEPHGRLIDAEELKKIVANAKHMDAGIFDGKTMYSDHLCIGADYDDVCAAIDETRTIIPAEEGET